MKQKRFKYIYGPVPSWRLGSSLGVDLLCAQEKYCSFDCIYCQLGKTTVHTARRGLYVSTKKVVEEIRRLPKVKIDYITFSGRGEPTLALNLGKTIKEVKKLRKEAVAVLTNGTLLHMKEVRKALALADFVVVKLDADAQKMLELVNLPTRKIKFSNIIKGIKQFRKEYRGRLALQIMFVKENKETARNIASLAQHIQPDEVQINTPKRASPVKPLPRKTIFAIKRYFREMKVVSVYDAKKKKVKPISAKATLIRRGKNIE